MSEAPVQAEEAAADPAILRRSLERVGEVTVRETHGSTIFLVGDRVFKLRKPVHFDYVDLRSAGARAQASRRDLELGQALAPGIVLGSRSVVPSADGTGYVIAPADASGAIDHVVEMRRYDDADTMRGRLGRQALTLMQARAVGVVLAEFHRGAKQIPSGVDHREVVDRNFEALLPLAGGVLGAIEWLALQRFASAFLIGWADVLKARAAAGAVVDGHGDLRAEHVLIEGERVRIVDRLEIDPLRACDVADELGTLLADLEDLGAPAEVGRAVLAGYREAGGMPQPDALTAFFGAYRAQMRAKVTLLRAAQLTGDAAASATEHALGLLRLSRHLGWRARGPLLLLVTGPAASGKSTLAAALAEASGFRVLSSDAIRREADGASGDDYSLAARARVYGELARRAGDGRPAIIDATFGEPALRRAFDDGVEQHGVEPPLVIECHAPVGERVARATLRAAAGTSDSDAGADEAQAQAATFTSVNPPGGQLWIDTLAPIAMQVDTVSSWLDSLLATGRTT